MLIEIIKHTPLWVLVLFIVLIAMGYSQSKDRTVSRGRLSIIPIVMILLSFYGVLSAFGVLSIGIIFWFAGILIAVVVGIKAELQGVTFSTKNQLFFIPGSWLPLALMMALFFTKYTVGVVLARHLPVANSTLFIGIVSLCYGLFSGVFLARTIAIRRSILLVKSITNCPT